MKKQFPLLQIVLTLFVATLLCFYACNKGQVSDDTTKQKTTNNNSQASASGECYFPLILQYVIPGRQPYGSPCLSGIGLCHVVKAVYGSYVPCPKFKLPSCQVVDCGDPLNYGNIGYPPDYEKYFPNNPLESAFVPIKVTPNIAMLQFYAEIKGTLDSKTLTLSTPFSLTKEVAKNLGLAGDAVPAGTYPVNYDAKNKTLNAIVSVK